MRPTRTTCGNIARNVILTVLPQILSIDQDHCIASWDKVLIQIWRGPIVLEAVRNLLKFGHDFLLHHIDHACSSLSIFESTSPAPTESVRQALSACYREFTPRMRHQIFVAEGSAVRARLIRAVGLALSMMGPVILPFEYASSVDEAALTIASAHSPDAPGAKALTATIAGLRIELDHYSGGVE